MVRSPKMSTMIGKATTMAISLPISSN